MRIASLKATSTLLLVFLIKSNLLRLKGGVIGGLVTLTLIFGLVVSISVAGGAGYYIYWNRKLSDNDEIKSGNDMIDSDTALA